MEKIIENLQEKPGKWAFIFSIFIFIFSFLFLLLIIFGSNNAKDFFVLSSGILVITSLVMSWIFSVISFFLLFALFGSKKQKEFYEEIMKEFKDKKPY